MNFVRNMLDSPRNWMMAQYLEEHICRHIPEGTQVHTNNMKMTNGSVETHLSIASLGK